MTVPGIAVVVVPTRRRRPALPADSDDCIGIRWLPRPSLLTILSRAPDMPTSRNANAVTVGNEVKSKVANVGKTTSSDAASESARSRSATAVSVASGSRWHRYCTRTAA